MKLFSGIVGIIFLISLNLVASAQDNCEQQLAFATDEFNAGRFYGVPQLLKKCIDNGFSKEQRLRAYLLLTQVYLLLDDPIAAEDSYLKLLRANPEFETNPDRDPIDVVYLSKRFTAAPKFSVFGRVGSNASLVRVIHSVYPSSGELPVTNKYTLMPGISLSAGLEYHFNENISLNSELNFSSTAYKKNQSFRFERDQLKFVDKQTWLSIPFTVKYSDHVGKYRPYGFLGYSVNFLLTDKGEIAVDNNDLDVEGSTSTTKSVQSPALNLKAQRNALNYSFILGGGVKYKWKLDFLFAEFRYQFGMKNIVNADKIFSSDVMQRYGHADDYLRLDNLSLALGYSRPLYKPRRLKKARTRSLLRFIKNKSSETYK